MRPLVALLLLSACQRSSSAAGPVLVHVDGGAGGEASVHKERGLPILADTLHPLITARAPYGAAPTAILVDLLHPITDEEGMKKPPGDVLTLDPPVAGETVWESPSRLRFEPKGPLLPEQTVKATLASLPTKDGPLAVSATGAVTAPRFALHHAELAVAAPGSAKQWFEASFSGPVSPGTGSLSVILADGTSLPAAEVSAGSAPHKVKFSATSPALTRGGQVDVEVGPGVRGLGGGEAMPTRSGVTLPTQTHGPAHILSVRAVEGADGFVLDVTCDDKAVEGQRWYWDDAASESHELSERCELAAASLSAVHTEPAVPLTVSGTDHGFRLKGTFTRGSYALRIDAGATTRDGGVLTEPWEGVVFVPGRSPEVRFLSQGRYLPRDGWKQIPLQHRNLGALDVTIRHIPKNNLLFWMTGDSETADERTSTVVVDERLPVRGDVDVRGSTVLDLSALLPHPEPGVYEVNASFGDHTDAMRVVVSDLQLVAKQRPTTVNEDAVQVWVVGAHDLADVAATEVSLVQPSGAVLATCSTDSSGSCTLRASRDRVDTTAPVAILASHGDELTWLAFRDVEIPQAEQDVSGEPFTSDQKLRASLQADRGVYRPGETLHLAAVLRDAATMVAPSVDVPVRLDVEDARGRVVRQIATHANEAGLLAADVALSTDAPTGRWSARVVVGDEVIARQPFQVEDFVPERMRVDATVGDGSALHTAVPIGVDARYLFGGSAAGSRVEARCRVEAAEFHPKKNGQFRYGHAFVDDLGPRQLDLGTVTGVLDDAGHASVSCPAPAASVAYAGPGQLVADLAVFEAGSGRASRTSVHTPVHPADTYIGLRTAASRAGVGQPVTVEGVVVDWTGELNTGDADLELEIARIEHEYDWIVDATTGEQQWTNYRRAQVQATQKVSVRGGRFRFTATADDWSEALRLRVRGGGASSDLVRPVGGYWDDEGEGMAQDATPRPLAPARIEVTAPKLANVGEDIQVAFEAPFKGRALVTVETDTVLQHTWIDVEPGPVTWTAKLDGWVPNAWLGVLVLKDPHSDDASLYLPDRAWGTTSVRIAPTQWTQALTLAAPAEVRSGATLEVSLSAPAADGPTWVALAAVDEGILQVTRFETPDPLARLQPRRALGVATFETLGWNVARGALPAGAGGDGSGLPTRPSPIKPVALWSGLIELVDGHATVKLDIPDYNGKLRLMAISASPGRVGSAEASVSVRDPLVVLVTPPRYLLANDRAEVPVFVTNASGASQSVTLSAALSPLSWGGFEPGAASPISLVGGNETTFTLADGASHTAVFRLAAGDALGVAQLVVQARAGALQQRRSFDLAVDPAAPRTHRVVQIPVGAGRTPLAPYLAGWTPTTETTLVWTTPQPYAEALAQVDQLIRYPHGCIEQTTSTTRPLLFVGNLLSGIDPKATDRAGVDARIRAGLERVLAMQTPSGGFGYWPGDDRPVLWGSAYTTHLLLDARDAGHAVPAGALDEAIAWLHSAVDRASNGSVADGPDRLAEAYVHYVLARAEHPRKGRAAALLTALTAAGEPADGPTAEAAWLLRAALYRAGDRRFEAEVKAPDLRPLTAERRNDSTYYSDLRRRALMLAVHEELFPQDPGAEPLARLVASGVAASGSRGWTTQELSWAVTGLGKRSAGLGVGGAPASLWANGRALTGAEVATGLPDRRFQLTRASEYPDLAIDVTDPGSGPLQVILDSTGVRPDAPWKLGGQGLAVSRRFVNDLGGTLDLANLPLGAVVHVVTTVSNTTGVPMRNVALVDRLAAGWEIENPRLGQGADQAWVTELNLWDAEHLDLRDQALSLYGTLPAGAAVDVVYALRATTGGVFTLPPVEVGAMYDPDLWGRGAGAVVTVKGGWEPYFL